MAGRGPKKGVRGSAGGGSVEGGAIEGDGGEAENKANRGGQRNAGFQR